MFCEKTEKMQTISRKGCQSFIGNYFDGAQYGAADSLRGGGHS